VTANHLKRLFANQEVFNSLDRQVPGLSMSEADEKEPKVTEREEDSEVSAPSTPAVEPDTSPEGLPHLNLDTAQDDGTTPMNVVQAKSNPLASPPESPGGDSDSTIGARKKTTPEYDFGPRGDAVESSGVESSAKPFVSRLPRRTHPAAR
jgi:1-phosphatidylinositol-3-phosphate 5-kinase